MPVAPAMRIAAGLAMAVLVALLFSTSAHASPGAYRVLLTEPYPEGPHELGAQIATFPDVAAIDYADTSEVTPTAAQLSSYDVVVSVGDSSYLDREAWGNSLADYIDGGGVVVQAGYDSWEDAFPEGRFASGGYAPFIPGNNGNNDTSLGEFDASSPLMQGINSLASSDNTEPELAPGAKLIAKWANGLNAIATKGRVVTTTAWIGDDYGPGEWSGDYGRLIVNAVRTLGRQRLSVTNSNPAGGTVTGSGGISCGAVCIADFVSQTPVTLGVTPSKGFAFAGFSGACTGTTCALTMDSAKSVTANFAAFSFAKKVTRNKKTGTARVTVRVGTPGMLVLSGKKIKKRSRAVVAGATTLTVAAKGKARTKLLKAGKVKVKMTLTFTPSGGTTSSTTKTIQLKRTIR
jgi:Divergent InlB B-repeat domain